MRRRADRDVANMIGRLLTILGLEWIVRGRVAGERDAVERRAEPHRWRDTE